MSLAENLARLNAGCRELISLFEDNYASAAILERLKGLLDSKQQLEMLEISTSFRTSFAFINQEDLTEKLYRCWRFEEEICNHELKKIIQRIKAVDPKTEKNDPEIMIRLGTLRRDAEEKKSRVSLAAGKLKLELKIPLGHFKDVSFDAISFFNKSRQMEEVITQVGDGHNNATKDGVIATEKDTV